MYDVIRSEGNSSAKSIPAGRASYLPEGARLPQSQIR